MELGKAEDYGNDATIEYMWAMKAYEHATTYYKIISSVDPQGLKLTPHDDKIYNDFIEAFPNFSLQILNVDELKSEEAKEKWRPWCNNFEKVVEDFNMATLLRLDCSKGYEEENTILVTRIQFFAIEITRNRKGLNNCLKDRLKTS